jgi:hypothetical protein
MSGFLLALAFVGPPVDTSPATPPVAEHGGKAKHRKKQPRRELMNAVSIKGGYAYLVLAQRESQVEGEEAPENEHLGGFEISYERTLIDNWLGLEFAKPFYFAPDRFDSPFELKLKLVHRWKFVEPYLGLGLTFNIRGFDGEREEVEGRKNDLSFGIAAAAGVSFWIARQWALEIAAGYAWVPVGHVVNHEVSAVIGPVFAFF